jgi:hypothetical protein
MSHTAFSQQFDGELDFKQLLKLRGVTASLDQTEFGLSQTERDWMRSDLLCPSCRCGGATLVRSDVAKGGGRNTRQAHFRFIDASGHTAHKLGCDFYALDDVPGIQRGVDVHFAANDKGTRVVRELVCKAISIGELSKTNIFEMRSWFLSLRDTNSFAVQGTAAMVDWLYTVRRLPTYEGIPFEPVHATLPGFDPRRAAERELAFLYRDFARTLPRVRLDAAARDRTKRLIIANQGQKLIAMESLRPQLEATVLLASLMVEYGTLPLTRRRVGAGLVDETPPALLAFSATLLFVSDWNVQVGLNRFAKIIAASLPEDLTLGNVMGLNPFHDFGALELARFVAGLQPESQRAYDFQAEMAAVLAKIDSARHVELVAD